MVMFYLLSSLFFVAFFNGCLGSTWVCIQLALSWLITIQH